MVNVGADNVLIVKYPLITEKATKLAAERKYVFCVDKGANKITIKRDIEKKYSVKVEKVATFLVEGKTKRLRWNKPGKRPAWKKAIVTLKKGFEIKPA